MDVAGTKRFDPRVRVQSLQVLRGVAAGLVVLAHCIEHAPGQAVNPILLTGRFGVELFFVISGFVIIHVAGPGPFRPAVFMAKRIWRVVPLYWTLTLLIAAATVLVPRAFARTKFDFGLLAASLAFIPYKTSSTSGLRPLFKLGWTLNYEMFFYAVIAALFWCRTMRQRVGILGIFFFVLVIGSFVVPPNSVAGFYLSLNVMPFALGAGLALLWHLGVFERLDLTSNPLPLAVAVATTIFAVAALAYERRLQHFRAAEWLGDISYSLYLTHMFVVGVGWAVLNRLHVVPASLAGGLGIIVMFAASVVVSHFVYRMFERPLMKLRLWPSTQAART
jgi:exopolysaccharide production protein ExoZ